MFKDPTWEPKTLNFDSHVALARRDNGRLLDLSPDLSAFARRGGKMLMYQGWSDTAIPPRGLPEYFDDAIARAENGASAVKLFIPRWGT